MRTDNLSSEPLALCRAFFGGIGGDLPDAAVERAVLFWLSSPTAVRLLVKTAAAPPRFASARELAFLSTLAGRGVAFARMLSNGERSYEQAFRALRVWCAEYVARFSPDA